MKNTTPFTADGWILLLAILVFVFGGGFITGMSLNETVHEKINTFIHDNEIPLDSLPPQD